MIKTLRRKYVLVTMLYLVSVIGILFAVDTLYSEYLDDMNMRGLLEWIAVSNILFDTDKEFEDEMVLKEIEEEDNPIVGVILDADGNRVFQRCIGGKADKDDNEDIIRKIADKPMGSYKAGTYIYTKKQLKNNNMLIIYTDTSDHEYKYLRILNTVLIIAGAAGVLFLITFKLSSYVTEPARRALEREKQFISDASHELKTPLSAISVNAQALELDGNNGFYVGNIISETKRMNRLIERLLTLSRLEENMAVNRSEFSLSDVVEEMMLTYESVAYEKQIRLGRFIEAAVTYNGDEDDIRQLIVILLDNAIKNTNDNGEINVSLVKKKNGIKLVVQNTGEIIKREDIEHIFERFYTTDQSRSSGSFGLGLSIARAIVEKNSGTIDVTSCDNEGTVFTIYLK